MCNHIIIHKINQLLIQSTIIQYCFQNEKESSRVQMFKKGYSDYLKIEWNPVENFRNKNKITRRINIIHLNGQHNNLLFIIFQEI